jgi:hypothetical protein
MRHWPSERYFRHDQIAHPINLCVFCNQHQINASLAQPKMQRDNAHPSRFELS